MRKKDIINWVLGLILLCSLVGLIYTQGIGIKENQQFKNLSNIVNESTQSQHNITDVTEDLATDSQNNALEILPQYQELYAQNSDLAGWIKIDGTKLDYPIMYTPNDVEYYLRRAFDKTDSIAGTPFIGYDCRLQPQSDNLLIYGHNMKNGSMFTTILSYKDKDFWEQHPIIRFDTLYEESQYEIMAAFYVTADVGNGHFEFYNFTAAANEEEFNQFVDTAKKLSLYDTGITAAYGDKLITLTTCSYHSENGRFVVIARKK